MNKFLSILLTCALVTLSAAAYGHPPDECPSVDQMMAPTDGVLKELVVPFTYFQGEPVAFVYSETDGRASLRVPLSRDMTPQGPLLFLVSQVNTIVESGDTPFPLANTGYSVVFKGEYALWAPWTTMTHGGQFKSLGFGDNVTLEGNTFTVHGSSEAPPYSWY